MPKLHELSMYNDIKAKSETGLIDSVALVIGLEWVVSLGLIRSLGEAAIPTFGVHIGDGVPFAAKSRYCLDYKTISDDPESVEDLLLAHINSLCDYFNCPVTLFPASDKFVTMANRLRNRMHHLAKTFDAPVDCAEQLMSKKAMLTICESVGVRVAKSVALKPGFTVDEITDVTKSMDYPVILKPDDSIDVGKEGFFVVENDQRMEAATNYVKNYSQHRFLVQEYVDGGDEQNIEVFALLAPNKEVYISCMFFKHRVYPPKFGSSAYVETFWDDDIAQKVRLLAKAYDFSGILDFEFKRSASNGKLYFMEVNFRAGAPIYLATAAGINLPKIAVELFTKEVSYDFSKRLPEGVFWMNDQVDWGNIRNNRISLKKYLSDLLHSDSKALWNLKDIRPFLYWFLNLLKYKIRAFISE